MEPRESTTLNAEVEGQRLLMFSDETLKQAIGQIDGALATLREAVQER